MFHNNVIVKNRYLLIYMITAIPVFSVCIY